MKSACMVILMCGVCLCQDKAASQNPSQAQNEHARRNYIDHMNKYWKKKKLPVSTTAEDTILIDHYSDAEGLFKGLSADPKFLDAVRNMGFTQFVCTDDNTKRYVLDLTASGQVNTRYDKFQVNTRYDKFKGATLIEMTLAKVGRPTLSDGHSITLIRYIELGGAFSCTGETDHCSPSTVELFFDANTVDWVFNSRTEDVSFLVDGKPLSGGRASWDGQVLSAENLREYLDLNITPEILEKLASAKQVDVQIGGLIQFSLTQQNLDALNSLNNHVTHAKTNNDPN